MPDQNVQLILKSYLPAVLGTTLSDHISLGRSHKTGLTVKDESCIFFLHLHLKKNVPIFAMLYFHRDNILLGGSDFF